MALGGRGGALHIELQSLGGGGAVLKTRMEGRILLLRDGGVPAAAEVTVRGGGTWGGAVVEPPHPVPIAPLLLAPRLSTRYCFVSRGGGERGKGEGRGASLPAVFLLHLDGAARGVWGGRVAALRQSVLELCGERGVRAPVSAGGRQCQQPPRAP